MGAGLLNVESSQLKQIAGWVEEVTILPEGLELQAKLDTGADHSSLDVKDLAQFEREGATWARFDVTNHLGKSARFERKILRVSRIRLHRGGPQPRPVVLLGICLGNHRPEVEVNLVDRSGFKYPLLIGRSFLQGRIAVDPAMEFVLKPECRGVTEQ